MVQDDGRSDWTGCGSNSTMTRSSDAGIAFVATLAGRLRIEALAGRLVRLRRDRAGAANAGRTVMALLFGWCSAPTASTTQTCCARAGRAGCWEAACRHRRRWGRFCGRFEVPRVAVEARLPGSEVF